jgi:hypothetical protein
MSGWRLKKASAIIKAMPLLCGAKDVFYTASVMKTDIKEPCVVVPSFIKKEIS